MPRTDRPAPPSSPEAPQERLQALLHMRVSEVLDTVPGALEVLVAHGFAPLAQPAMRRVLAPSVTLDQAIRLRGLAEPRRDALLRRLAAAALPARGGGCR